MDQELTRQSKVFTEVNVHSPFGKCAFTVLPRYFLRPLLISLSVSCSDDKRLIFNLQSITQFFAFDTTINFLTCALSFYRGLRLSPGRTGGTITLGSARAAKGSEYESRPHICNLISFLFLTYLLYQIFLSLSKFQN